MMPKAPHFVLFSESTAVSPPQVSVGAASDESTRHWHFVLRTEEGSVALDAEDEEADASDERLALLAVVRGLEALPEPSRVTLVTTSGWIRRGLRFGLDSWRDHQWQWERFGQMTPVKNGDLWRRVSRAQGDDQDRFAGLGEVPNPAPARQGNVVEVRTDEEVQRASVLEAIRK